MRFVMMTPELRKKFLTNTDETGRFIVTSLRTGKQYAFEPMEGVRRKWGSIDPATGELMNKKGAGKYRGAIDKEESLITEENGFKNIKMIGVGVSPMDAVEVEDAKYPDKK